jgi:RHS repeat-associated protein
MVSNRRAPRRTGLLAILLALGFLRPSFGSPGDVFQTEMPILGGEPPRTRDLKDGDASVSTQTGALQYSYPLSLPPGRRVAPSLSLTYSSSAANYGSIVGSGWSLSVPEIRRDPAQSWLASQSPDYVPRFVSSMAGGQRLVPTGQERGISACDVADTFRAQYDSSYTRYEQLNAGGAICHNLTTTGVWRARTTDGLTHIYGEPAQMGGTNDPTWAPLTRTIDEFGNEVKYFYSPVQKATGQVVEHVLVRVEYTSNAAAGIAAHAQIHFDYGVPSSCGAGTSSDLPVGARFEQRDGQVRWVGARRLNAIRTEVRSGSGWRPVRTVALAYDESADDCGLIHGPIRLLTGIQESATSPTGVTISMPAVTFSYGPLAPGARSNQPFDSGFTSSYFGDSMAGGFRLGPGTEWPQLETMLLDFDGDGRLDRLAADPDSAGCAFRWQRNEGDGFGPQSEKIRLPTFQWGNGSGGTTVEADCSLSGQRSFFENRSNPSTCELDNTGHYLSYRFLDLNGDGLPELVAGLQMDWRYLDPSPAFGPSPIPSEWGWDPDAVCSSSPSASEGSCPDVVPDLLEAAQICEPAVGCELVMDLVDLILGAAPQVPCGNLMEPPGTDPDTCPPPRVHLNQCGDYLWLIYWNQGSGLLDPVSSPTPRFSPIPLESNAQDTGMGSRRLGFSSNLHAVIDVDGDGLLDVLTRIAAVANNGFVVFRGDGAGNFLPISDGEPYIFNAPDEATTGRTGATWHPDVPLGSEGFAQVLGWAGIMDVSGDGLPDLLFARNDAGDPPVKSFLNLGNRFHEPGVDDPEQPLWLNVLTQSVAEDATIDLNLISGTRAGWVTPLDLDQDGRLDLYVRTDTGGTFDGNPADDQGYIRAGDGGGSIAAATLLSSVDRDGVRQYLEATDEFRVRRDYVDLNGDGAMDYVTPSGSDFLVGSDSELLAGKPLRLLNRIDNGAGGVTDVRYRAASDPAIDIAGTDDRLGMPTHTWVVDTITTSENSDSDSQTGSTSGTTTYRYGRPVYNQERYPHPVPAESFGRYGFRGFERVQVTSPLGAVTESVYDYDLDWSGRLAETSTYTSASEVAAGTPDSIEQATWQALTLFCPGNEDAETDEATHFYCPSQPAAVPAISFQPVDRKSWTCSSEQIRDTCLASGALRVETTEWLAKEAEGGSGGVALLYHEFELWRKVADAIQTGDRMLRTRTSLFSGADYYRLRPSTETRWERTLLGNRLRGQREHTWTADPAGRPGAFEERVVNLSEMGVSSTELRYNELNLGLVTGRKKPEQFHSAGPRSTIAYDDAFKVHPTATTNERGHQVQTDFDLGTGALVAQRGPNSVSCGTGCTELEQTRTVIDGFGRPLEAYQTTEDPADGSYREVLVERFTYVDGTQPSTLPQRVVEERLIDWNGSLFTRTETQFDGFGHAMKRIESRFESGKPDSVERFRFDPQGNVARAAVRDPSQDTNALAVYLYDFDPLNRPSSVERPDGTRIEWTYDGLETIRREIAASGPEAETTTTEDVFGRLVQVDERIDTTAVATTRYTWDANDNPARVESPDGIVTELAHDWLSRRTSIRRGQRTWSYTYDRNGNLLTERVPLPPGANPILDGPRYTTSTVYDVLDRPTSRIAGTRELTEEQRGDLGTGALTFAYDDGLNGLGRLTSVTSPLWTRSYQHDARGNLVQDSFDFDLEPALGVAIADTRTLVRSFNPIGAVVEEWHGDGSTPGGSTHTTTAYDRRGLPKTLTWQQTTPIVLATATRNGAGLVTALGNGTTNQVWTHDSIGRVTSMQASSTLMSPPVQISEAFTYYGTDDPQTLATFRAGLGTQNFTFSFDDRHQLVFAENDADYTGDFSYTPGGRLATATVTAPGGAPLAPPRDVEYIYPTVAEVTLDPEAVKELRSGPLTAFLSYGFDSAGNVTSRGDGANNKPDFDFLFDGDDQQRIATQVAIAGLPLPSAGDHELYFYDHAGQRILSVSRLESGVVTKARLWMGSLEVEYSGTGSVTRTFANVGLDRPIARIEDLASARRVVHGQLGHFLGAFAPDNSELDVAFVYGPFGEILAQLGDAPEDFTRRFNGKEQDQLTDLSYYGARYFDPLSLTWTQADPLYRFAPHAAWNEPRRANVYAFSLQNPLRYADPDGREPTYTVSIIAPPGNRSFQASRAGEIAAEKLKASGTNATIKVSVSIRPLSGVKGSTPRGGARILLGNTDQIADLVGAGKRISGNNKKRAEGLGKQLAKAKDGKHAGLAFAGPRGKGGGTAFIASDVLRSDPTGAIGYPSQTEKEATALGNLIAHEIGHTLGLTYPGGMHPDDAEEEDLMNADVSASSTAAFTEQDKQRVRKAIDKKAVNATQ